VHQTTAPPPVPPQLSTSPPTGPDPGALRSWLDRRRNAGDTPDRIAEDLVAAGWNADAAAGAALSSLRSSDRHRLAYGALTVSVGLAALAGATSMHLLLRGEAGDPYALAEAITVLVAATPVAGWSARVARDVEGRSAHATWSPSRRWWFGALALCTAVVGIVRVLVYVHDAALSLTGASSEPLTATALAQVAVSVGVAVPLFWWALREWRRSALLVSGLRDPQPFGPTSTGPAPSGPQQDGPPPVPSWPWTPPTR
jgi:hypothetical protein